MYTRRILVLVGILMLALLTACGGNTTGGSMSGMDHGAMPMGTGTPMAMMDSTAMPMPTMPMTDTMGMPGMDHGAMTMTEVQFLDGMVVHHQGAVTMATEALTKATRPEVKALAQAIVDAQGPEIAQLQEWRGAWYPNEPATDQTMMDMMGMGDMTVAPGDPATYDQRFLTAMISHHRGAIQMAEAIKTTATHPELKAFAEKVITDQTAEIATMEKLLATPSGSAPDPMDMSGMNHGPMDMTEVEFLDGMVVHHQGAVTMATEALTQATRPEIKALAQTIIDAQTPEVAQLQAWRTEWYAQEPATDPAMLAMMGMGDMTVATDTNKPYDERFLEAMISHHWGAIQMAEGVKMMATHPELIAFAEKVITDQTAEIKTMEAWLTEWRTK